MKRWLAAMIALPLSALATERIVSIGGDVTQIIYALDAQQTLVARDSTSLQPALATHLPDVGYMRQLNAEGILAMKPSLVLTSAQAKPSLALQQVEQAGVRVITVTGATQSEAINEKIATIAHALHREEQGKTLRDAMTTQLAAIPRSPLPVKVLFIMAHSGMNALGAGNQTAADAAIKSVGLINAFGDSPRYQSLTQEGVIASAPQLVVVSADGLNTLGGEQNLWKLPGLAMTPAGIHQQLLVIDDMALLGFGIDTPSALAKLRKVAEAIAP
ncbi:Hemin-binding periplasmic protein [Paramixta manurensis]|uniref:Hemin-binding periplasmic protein n=1 Tax=Paramixta manurensis TaxID=2740817 RepID=A0A6M8UBF7_9GAMM|nr:Hemin-binding periplasmic protein [Erwiniaceae bacterium PD-1]